ncbi:MAG: hypothetical protein ACOZCO_07950 [Bacteroidota bacterium]
MLATSFSIFEIERAGLIDIMILNMDGSVEGELEVQLLKEDL